MCLDKKNVEEKQKYGVSEKDLFIYGAVHEKYNQNIKGREVRCSK